MIKKKFILAAVFGLLLVTYVNCSQNGFQTQSLTGGAQTSLSSSLGSVPSPSTIPSPSATPSVAQPVAPGPVPGGATQKFVFLAQGHVGRTVMSCDEGKTWIHDRSDNQSALCWVNGDPNFLECDHNAGSAAGLDYGDGWFYAGFGHGAANATARKSRDGINWQTIYTDADGGDGAGIFYNKGSVFWIEGKDWPISNDYGATWTRGRPSLYMMAYGASKLDNIIVTSEDAPGGLVSLDYGKTFNWATLTNVLWGRDVQLLMGNGHSISVSSQWNGTTGDLTVYVAETKDGGLSWSGKSIFSSNIGASGISSAIFNGKEFVTWFDKKMWKSTNGTDWTSTPIVTSGNVVLGPVALSPNGVYVSIPNVWGSYYSAQKAYYSTDGVNWVQGKIPGSHPIYRIIGGYVDASVCGQ